MPGFHRTCYPIKPSLSLGHPCIGCFKQHPIYHLPRWKASPRVHPCTRLHLPLTDAIVHAHDEKKANMKRPLVIHPFLFGMFFVLALYSANVTEVSFSQVLLPFVVVLSSTIAILLLAWLLLRSLRRAALLTSIAVILCFSYGHVVNLLPKSPLAGYTFYTPIEGSAILIWLAWALVFGASIYFVWKTRRISPKWTTLLNVVGAVLVVMPLTNIVVQEARGSRHHTAAPDTSDLQLSVPETPPDIYYIILDRYASASTLKERLDFDNSEFLDYLSDKGFYVASESRDNYLSTQHSLASSLNMEYLDGLVEEVGETTTGFSPLYAMLQEYEVWRLLKSADYQFIHVGSWWEPTRENKYADVNINYGGSLPEFSNLLLRTTAIDPIGRIADLWGDPRTIQYERVKYEFDRLSQIPNMEAPTFTFAHFLTPHPEYVFMSNGDFLPEQELLKESFEAKYLDQLVATNNMVESVIDRLLADSAVPPIIILQSDEGPYPDFNNTFNWTEGQGSDLDLRVKSGILNAYYFPGVDQSVFYPSITPVNSFRLLFNLYFGTNLELLPDKYYYSYPRQPYRFIDVTERLQKTEG